MDTYLEDLKTGTRMELGSHTVTEEAIIRFGKEFDPQPFHVDREGALRSPFGGLVASGWHTAAIGMRLLVDGMAGLKSFGSPGVDEMRWLKPVRPGDTLRLSVEVADSKVSASKPDRGTVWLNETLHNQHGEVVMTRRSMGIIARRP